MSYTPTQLATLKDDLAQAKIAIDSALNIANTAPVPSPFIITSNTMRAINILAQSLLQDGAALED